MQQILLQLKGERDQLKKLQDYNNRLAALEEAEENAQRERSYTVQEVDEESRELPSRSEVVHVPKQQYSVRFVMI